MKNTTANTTTSLKNKPLIRVHNMEVGYRGQAILPPLSFEASAGELWALIGRNGKGKTTLLRCLAGLDSPLSGDYQLLQQAASGLSASAWAKIRAWVGTERLSQLNWSVKELLESGRHPHTDFWGRLSSEDARLVQQVAQRLSIEALLPRRLSQLSDGQRQKVLLGRALVQDAPCLFLDEPTAHLDLVHRSALFELLREEAERGKLLLLATHELSLALNLAHKIILLDEEDFFIGSPQALRNSGRLERLFGAALRYWQL